jgi:hypothetical protein
MTDQTPNLTPETAQEPFIPPQYLLALAGIFFIVALGAFLLQGEAVVLFGALAFGILSLIVWVLMAPKQAGELLTGRSLRYGGASVLITVLLLVAMGVIYVLARGANISRDITEGNDYSLTSESRDAMQSLAVDPTLPQVRMLAFYGLAQASVRERDSLLLDEYVQASGNKITFEFVDPDQRPDLIERFVISREGSIVIGVPDEQGQLDPETAEVVTPVANGRQFQQSLTNAILRASAQGNFVAYFLIGQETVNDNMSLLKQTMTTRYDWTVQDISLLQLTSPEGEFRLNDEARDGEVVVIPGGFGSFTPEELQLLTDYMNGGGDVIIFSDTSFGQEGAALATDPALNDYLFTNFGLRLNNDIVIDQTQAFNTPLFPVADNLDSQSFITNNGIPTVNALFLLQLPHSITVAEALPQNVQVSRLVQTSPASYVKSDLTPILAAQDNEEAFAAALAEVETDPQGPIVVAASSENTQTGARVVVFGSLAAIDDLANLQGVYNFDVAFNSIVWATNFNDFVQTVTVAQTESPTDAAAFADEATLRTINLVTQILIPFGILGIGFIVWYTNRERRRE